MGVSGVIGTNPNELAVIWPMTAQLIAAVVFGCLVWVVVFKLRK
jgi:hypothetical protein